jgi:hypothetical protein
MKASRTGIRTSVVIFVSGLFAVAALAGPGPQYSNRPAAKPGAKSEAPKTEAPSAAKCDGCKTTPVWVMGDRVPAGKGVGLHVVGTKHECSRCSGAVATENGKVKNNMAHNAACGPLLCCK